VIYNQGMKSSQWIRSPSALGTKVSRSAVACFLAVVAIALIGISGCDKNKSDVGSLDLVTGRRGISEGRFQKPRAIAIDKDDRLYIVDMTARIQVFDADGNFIRFWQTPAHEAGRPTGLSIDRDGNVVVPDTHYYRVLFYTPEGVLLENRTIGGTLGTGPGEFGLVTDVVQDTNGNYYVSEYGEFDRIQKFSHDGKFITQWGSHGEEPGQFSRPQGLAIDEKNQIWVGDACNHRIQVFDSDGRFLKVWGQNGTEPGKLSYPYNLVLDGEGYVYVCEYGNHRIQKFTLDGQSLGTWGSAGSEEGELFNPWGLARDSKGRIHVLDSYNHRVQRVKM
jgi:sugar lactone lactonase YvrE